MNPLDYTPVSARRVLTGGVLIAASLGWFLYAHCSWQGIGKVNAGPTATYRLSHGKALLPDPAFTPGLVREHDAAKVCNGQSTKAFRKPGIQAVYALYGAKKSPMICCEIDHLISLELGGDNGVKNEWPQPYEPRPGAHEKDQVENWLHLQVCAGHLSLAEAQAEIATDWYDVYLRMTSNNGAPTTSSTMAGSSPQP